MPANTPVIEVHLQRFVLILVVRAPSPSVLRAVRLQLSRLPYFTEYRTGVYGVHLIALEQLRRLLGPFLVWRVSEKDLAEAQARLRAHLAARAAQLGRGAEPAQGSGGTAAGHAFPTQSGAASAQDAPLLPPSILHNIRLRGDEVLRPPGLKPTTVPRHYQTLAQEWFVTPKGSLQILGGLCADETGLGKTLEAILGCLRLLSMGVVSRVLWITQPHLIYQAAVEWEENTEIPYLLITSGMAPAKRRQLYARWDSGVLILSYPILRNDIHVLRRLSGRYAVVLDEAAILRNRNKTFRAVRRLRPQVWMPLTATPMQNGPQDIFTLMELLHPDILGPWSAFRDRYLIMRKKFRNEMIVGYRKDRLPELHRIIAPYILRRRTEDVTDEIPDVVEQFVFVPMTEEQKRAHDYFQEQLFAHSEQMENATSELEFRESFREYQRRFGILQRIATHPVLMLESSSPLIQEYLAARPLTDLTSPKVEALKGRLAEIILGSEDRVVVFTESERLARRIHEELTQLFAQPEYRRLAHPPAAVLWTGQMDKRCRVLERGMQMNCHACPLAGECTSREKSKWLFMNDPHTRVIIVVTKAGETGLNLQRARYLFNMELSWNPGVVAQQIGRIRRLKSPHDRVFVTHFVSKDSIDEIIMRVVYKKRRMSETVVENTAEEQQALMSAMREVHRIIRQTAASHRRVASGRRSAASGARRRTGTAAGE